MGSVLLALTIAGIVVLAKRWMKLADVAHLKDDAERERRLREAIYGRLELEENK